jgi:hypothetical protein
LGAQKHGRFIVADPVLFKEYRQRSEYLEPIRRQQTQILERRGIFHRWTRLHFQPKLLIEQRNAMPVTGPAGNMYQARNFLTVRQNGPGTGQAWRTNSCRLLRAISALMWKRLSTGLCQDFVELPELIIGEFAVIKFFIIDLVNQM